LSSTGEVAVESLFEVEVEVEVQVKIEVSRGIAGRHHNAAVAKDSFPKRPPGFGANERGNMFSQSPTSCRVPAVEAEKESGHPAC
jgi:hypothetical protein